MQQQQKQQSRAREATSQSDSRWWRNRGGLYRCRPSAFCLLSTKNIICILVHRAQFLLPNDFDLTRMTGTSNRRYRSSVFLSLSSGNKQVESDRGRVSRSWNMATVTTHNILTFFSSFFRREVFFSPFLSSYSQQQQVWECKQRHRHMSSSRSKHDT